MVQLETAHTRLEAQEEEEEPRQEEEDAAATLRPLDGSVAPHEFPEGDQVYTLIEPARGEGELPDMDVPHNFPEGDQVYTAGSEIVPDTLHARGEAELAPDMDMAGSLLDMDMAGSLLESARGGDGLRAAGSLTRHMSGGLASQPSEGWLAASVREEGELVSPSGELASPSNMTQAIQKSMSLKYEPSTIAEQLPNDSFAEPSLSSLSLSGGGDALSSAFSSAKHSSAFSSAKHTADSLAANEGDAMEPHAEPQAPELHARHRMAVEASWALVEHDLQALGRAMFLEVPSIVYTSRLNLRCNSLSVISNQ